MKALSIAKPAKVIQQLLEVDVIEHPEAAVHLARDEMRLDMGRRV